MHQKTVYTIISLKLKEIECPCHRPPSSLPFMTNAKDICWGPKTKEKNAILLSLMVMMMILKMANECTEIFASFKIF